MTYLFYNKILLDIDRKRPIFIRIHGNNQKELFFNITKFKLKHKLVQALSGFP